MARGPIPSLLCPDPLGDCRPSRAVLAGAGVREYQGQLTLLVSPQTLTLALVWVSHGGNELPHSHEPPEQGLVRHKAVARRRWSPGAASLLWTLLYPEIFRGLAINPACGGFHFLSAWSGCLFHALSQHKWLHLGLAWVLPGVAEESCCCP